MEKFTAALDKSFHCLIILTLKHLHIQTTFSAAFIFKPKTINTYQQTKIIWQFHNNKTKQNKKLYSQNDLSNNSPKT